MREQVYGKKTMLNDAVHENMTTTKTAINTKFGGFSPQDIMQTRFDSNLTVIENHPVLVLSDGWGDFVTGYFANASVLATTSLRYFGSGAHKIVNDTYNNYTLPTGDGTSISANLAHRTQLTGYIREVSNRYLSYVGFGKSFIVDDTFSAEWWVKGDFDEPDLTADNVNDIILAPPVGHSYLVMMNEGSKMYLKDGKMLNEVAGHRTNIMPHKAYRSVFDFAARNLTTDLDAATDLMFGTAAITDYGNDDAAPMMVAGHPLVSTGMPSSGSYEIFNLHGGQYIGLSGSAIVLQNWQVTDEVVQDTLNNEIIMTDTEITINAGGATIVVDVATGNVTIDTAGEVNIGASASNVLTGADAEQIAPVGDGDNVTLTSTLGAAITALTAQFTVPPIGNMGAPLAPPYGFTVSEGTIELDPLLTTIESTNAADRTTLVG